MRRESLHQEVRNPGWDKIQPEDTAELSAQEKIRRLAAGVVRDLLPAPAAISISREPEILGSQPRIKSRKLAKSEKCTDRLLADHSEANGRPGIPHSQATGSPESSQGLRQGMPETLAGQPKVPGTAALSLRPRRQEIPKGYRTGSSRTSPSREGGGQIRKSRSALESVAIRPTNDPPPPPRDPFPRRCPLCRTRNRQTIGHDERGERIERMLCGPCQRMLRIRQWDRAAVQGRLYDLDPPAPLCHSCWHRPRISKGTRRGRRRYFRFCGPCGRAGRAARGKPAYRGERGRRMQAEDELRPVEERNYYPWPKAERESIYARSSSWEKLLAPPKSKAPAKIAPQPNPTRPEPLPSTRRRGGRRRNYRLITLWAVTDAWRAATAIAASTRAACATELETLLASVEPAQLVDHAALIYRGELVEVLHVDRGASRPSQREPHPVGSELYAIGPVGSRPPPRSATARPPLYRGGSPCPIAPSARPASPARAQ